MAQYLLGFFGTERARYVSRFPKDWFKLAYAATASFLPTERSRAEVLLRRVQQTCLFGRNRPYDPNLGDWLANALAQHVARPFRAIIASGNPTRSPDVIVAEEVDEEHVALLAPHSVAIPRTADALAGALASMAVLAHDILLIDPFFNLGVAGYRSTLAALLKNLAAAGRSNLTIQVHFRDHGSRPTVAYIKTKARTWITSVLPSGYRLELYEWKQRTGCEDLHDRYLICDVGGIMIGSGFQATSARETANLVLLDAAHALKIRGDYSPATAAFDLVHRILVDHLGAVTEG